MRMMEATHTLGVLAGLCGGNRGEEVLTSRRVA